MTSPSKLTLWVHDDQFSREDVVVNLDLIPHIKKGAVLELIQQQTWVGQGDPARIGSFLFMARPCDPELKKKQPNLQKQCLNFACTKVYKDKFDIQVQKELVEAQYIEIFIKDQYLSRADMWRLAASLEETCAWKGKKVEFVGHIRVQIREIYIHGQKAMSGYISKSTKPIFRSESARLLLFIQISREMWEFEEDGELFYNKAIDGFLTELFHRWKKMDARHLITIILLTRVEYDYSQTSMISPSPSQPENSAHLWTFNGHQDFYKVVVDNICSDDWSETLHMLKREFLKFKQDVLVQKSSNGRDVIVGRMSYALRGNILEAINLAANQFSRDYIDRDLQRTGVNVLIVTPGTGQFEVDEGLLKTTTELLIGNGVGIDLVSLSKMPLHSVPLFKYQTSVAEEETEAPSGFLSTSAASSCSISAVLGNKRPWQYALPHWVDISFWQSNSDSSERTLQKKRLKRRIFDPRCKMYELQMMGYMENELSSISIAYISEDRWYDETNLEGFYEKYDDLVFRPVEQVRLAIKEKQMADNKRAEAEARQQEERVNYEDSLAFGTSYHSLRKQPTLENLFRIQSSLSELLPSARMNKMPNIRQENADYFSQKSSKLSRQPSKIRLSPEFSSPEMTPKTKEPLLTRGFDIEAPKTQRGITRGPTVEPILISNPISRTPAKYLGKYRLAGAVNRSEEAKPESPRSPRQFRPSLESASAPPRPSSSKSVPLPWQTLVNPCNPSKNSFTANSQFSRWQHVNPQPVSVSSMKWKSMCSPAILPLSTDFFPSHKELSRDYQEYTYTVSIDPEETDLDQRALMNEMIAARLVQGYQIVHPSAIHTHVRRKETAIPTIHETTQEFGSPGSSIFLSMGSQIHQLAADPSGFNIKVVRYVRREDDLPVPLTQYTCLIWRTTVPGGYHRITENFKNLDIDTYNWNYVDHVIAGYEDANPNLCRLSQARFMLIPNDIPPQNLRAHLPGDYSDEEVRVAGIFKLCQLFKKGRWLPPEQREEGEKGRKDANALELRFTTLEPAAFASTLDADSDDTAQGFLTELLDRNVKLPILAKEMQGPKGIRLQDRRWHLRLHENVFVGSEFVTWIVQNFSDIHTRDDAVQYGNELKKQGLFEHSQKRHEFRDGHYFYFINSEYAIPKPGKSWFGSRKVTPNSSVTTPPVDVRPFTPNRRPKIALSRQMKYDLDPNRCSYRPEIVTLHYDCVHNPANVFHFRLEWLGVTGRLIDATLQSWARTAEKYGLRLVEAPLDQASSISSINPFREPRIVQLAIPPPPPPENQDSQFWVVKILKDNSFVLDSQAASEFPQNVDVVYSFGKPSYTHPQYVHQSGVAFIQITEKGYLWLTNRSYVSHSKGYSILPRYDPETLKIEFTSFCESPERLTEYYHKVQIMIQEGKLKSEVGDPVESIYPKDAR